MAPATPRTPCPGGSGKKKPCWARSGSAYCSNHDPALAETRRLNGCARKTLPPVELKRDAPRAAGGRKPENRPRLTAEGSSATPGRNWGPTKRELRELAHEALAERADAILNGPVPGDAELRATAKKVLHDIALRSGHEPSRVTASKALIELTQPSVEDDPAETDEGKSLAELFEEDGTPVPAVRQ